MLYQILLFQDLAYQYIYIISIGIHIIYLTTELRAYVFDWV